MFCEKCGTRVDDGQPFCPNCGNRLSEAPAPAAPADPGFAPVSAPNSAMKAPAVSGLLGKFNAKQGLEKIFYPIVGGLLVLNFILSLLPIYSTGYASVAMSRGYPFWSALITVLFTLGITFFVQDYFDKFSFKFLWLFIAIASALILLLYIILWIDSGVKLSVWGWFFFLFQIGLTACSVLLLLEKMKK